MEVKTEPVERQWRLDIVWPRYAYIFCWLKSAFRECEKGHRGAETKTKRRKPKHLVSSFRLELNYHIAFGRQCSQINTLWLFSSLLG